jgi:hypothetical protein
VPAGESFIQNQPLPYSTFEQTAPSDVDTPAAGRARLILDTDGLFKLKRDDGTVHALATRSQVDALYEQLWSVNASGGGGGGGGGGGSSVGGDLYLVATMK